MHLPDMKSNANMSNYPIFPKAFLKGKICIRDKKKQEFLAKQLQCWLKVDAKAATTDPVITSL